MKITAIGVGGAFTEELFHQCYVLSENGRNLFVDLGQQIIPFALKNAGLTTNDIHEVIITHCHDDHCLSLGTLGLKRYNWLEKPKHWTDSKKKYAPKLIINHNIRKELDDTTRGNFRTVEGFVASLETFFEVKELQDDEEYIFEGWKIRLLQQVHVMTNTSIMYSYGVSGHNPKTGKKFLITSDTQYFQPRQIYRFYSEADLIITDCETSGTNLKFQEGEKVYKDKNGEYHKWPEDDMKCLELVAAGIEMEFWKSFIFMSGVHSTYPELAGYKSANATILPPEIKKKLWLSHYGDHVAHGKDAFGNDVNWDEQAKKDGLAGFVKLGQVFEI